MGIAVRAAFGCLEIESLEARRLLAASVFGVTLFNADNDNAVGGTIANKGSVTVDLKSLPRITFVAASDGGSVRFGYDGQTNFRVESTAPFAFNSDNGKDYAPFTPTIGTHTVSATAFSGKGASGTAGATYQITVKVIDTGSSTSTPPTGNTSYFATSPTIPAQTVLFDNFDNGGEGVAYHDSDSTNDGGQYRSTGVDIENTSDSIPSGLQSQTGTGRALGFVRAGEWLKYSVNVTTAGTYKLGVRFASANAGGSAHVEVDGNNVGSFSLNDTGGFQTWKTIEKSGIVLPSGKHTLRFVIDSSFSNGDVGNLHWFRFTQTSGTTQPPTSTTVKWPNSWQTGPSAPSPRFESAGHVFGGKIYSFGGFKDSRFNVDRTYVSFDPNTNQWTKLGTLPVGMAETHMGVADDGHYIYFVGGFAGNFQHGSKPVQIASDKVWRYEPATNEWTQLKSLPTARGAGGASVIDGKLHYFGGNPKDRVTNLKDHIALDLSNQSAGWKLRAPMPSAKDHFSTITIGSKIYALGGEKGHDQLANIQKSVHVYDDSTDSWKQLADMPLTNSHSEGGTFVLDGQIVFAGGQYNHEQNSTNRVVAYNIQTNKWSELKPLPASRQGAIIGVFGNKVVLTLGAQTTSQPKSTTWIGYR